MQNVTTKALCDRAVSLLADGTVCKSAALEKLSQNKARIIITEGKYHQVKRMFGVVGLGVNELHRESIGGLILPEDLKVQADNAEGEYSRGVAMLKSYMEFAIAAKNTKPSAVILQPGTAAMK